MRTIINKLSSALLGLGLIFQSGCAVVSIGTGAAAGVGSYAYVSGELEASENASMEHAWDATLQAMQEMQYAVTIQAKDALGGDLIARTAQDKTIEIYLKAITTVNTEFKIRVGTFGDKDLSVAVMDKIKKQL